MRIIVTGSRHFTDRSMIYAELDHIYDRWVIQAADKEQFILVHGKCPYGGADQLAEDWATERNQHGAHVFLDPHPPDTDKYGKAAFGIRNRRMVQLGANQCLAFFQHGARNVGTKMTVELCDDYGIPVFPYWSNHKNIIDVELP